MWCAAIDRVPLVKVFCHLYRLANHHKSWFTFFARQNFTKTPKSNAGNWKESFFFIDQTVVGTAFPQTLIWCEKVEKDVNKTPVLDDEETKLLAECANAQLVHRSYGNVMLRLGKISAHWPWEEVRPAIVGPDGKEMKMKSVLTAEEIAGIAFRKQNVNQPLEQEKTGENAPATSGNKRKAAEASQSQQKKKKLTPKQREDKRNDNFVPIEPRSADLPPPSSGKSSAFAHTAHLSLHLYNHLLIRRVMDSGPVTDKFNAYVDAVKDHEVNKAVVEVIQACSLTPPYPDAVQKKLKEGTAAALLEAENATTTIPIPLIDAFAADPNMPIDGFLKEDF
ncbi:uncharacterized protein [Rutidosis leptorrhynchoides]|uniref:uncharacterized protein n=1 Tax=Rutidosis leptorrhynchoides TaxID=125765 RepID=UPI003A991651